MAELPLDDYIADGNDEGEGSMRIAEIIFAVTESDEGGYEARALGHSIFTQGENWNELKEMARDAVLCHFGEDRADFVRERSESGRLPQ